MHIFLKQSSIENIFRFDLNNLVMHFNKCDFVAYVTSTNKYFFLSSTQQEGFMGNVAWDLCLWPFYCTALHCTALHYTALQSTALHCTSLHCTKLNYTALHCTEQNSTAMQRTALQWTALHWTALWEAIRKKSFFSFFQRMRGWGSCQNQNLSRSVLVLFHKVTSNRMFVCY